ncbi:TPA: hypothetical protein ACH3X3_004026 [Trebouxia sp. C0006]
MPGAKRSGKHLLLPEVKKWYDTLASITWNDFKTAQDVRDFLSPPGSDKSGYGPMPTDLGKVYDMAAAGPRGPVPLKVYEPPGSGAFPIIVYFHGGGWVLGGNVSHRAVAATLASECKATVVAVDYALAPEYPYPAGVEDCWAAVQWAAQNAESINGDATRLAVCGESAGGTMSLVMSMLAKQHQQPSLIKAQVPLCPATDLFSFNSPSYEQFADDEFEGKDDILWFDHHYLSGPKNDPKDPLVSPLFAKDFSGLPPSLIITAEANIVALKLKTMRKSLVKKNGAYIEFI